MYRSLATPRGAVDDSTGETTGALDNPDFGNSISSFKSLGADHDILRAATGKRRMPTATPQRQVFGNITNRNNPGRNEFTPLLKSVQRSAIKQKVSGGKGSAPAFLGDNLSSSPGLPQGSSEVGDSTYRTGDDDETISGPAPAVPSSSVGTPIALPRNKDGVLEGEGQMTLREQEKIIDDIKKENFGLKLKVYFLNERLDKLGPEYNDAAIKENIEIKVERATLVAELKRYKKSLLESEKAIANLRQEMLGMQDNTQKKYAAGRRTEEEARAQQELAAKLSSTQAQLQGIIEENDRLREQGEEYREQVEKLEGQGGEELRKLQQEIETLEDEKTDLEAELREKERLLEEREEELEGVEEKFKERDERIKELEEDTEAMQARIHALEEKGKGLGEKEEALLKKDEALRTAQRNIEELERVVEDLQGQVKEERSHKSEAIAEIEQLQRQNQRLESDKSRLEDDLEKVRDDVRNKSFSYRGRLQEQDSGRDSLRAELKEARQEIDNLHAEGTEREKELKRLEDKLNEVGREFDGETKALRSEMNILKREHDMAVKTRNELDAELRRTKSELNHITSEKDLLHMRHDALTNESATLQSDVDKLKRNLREARESLEEEKNAAASNNQALRKDWGAERDQLAEDIDTLERELKGKERQHERTMADWKSEKRQLDAKAERAEDDVKRLHATIEALQAQEHTIQGKEARLSDALKNEQERYKATEQSLKRQIAELQDEIEGRKASFDLKVVELNNVSEELRKSRKAEKMLEERAGALDDEVELLSVQLEEEQANASEQIESAKSEVDSLRQKLNAAKFELNRLENQHANVRADIETYKGDIQADARVQEQLQKDLQEAHRRLENAKKEKQQLQEQLTSIQSQMNSLKITTVEIEAERDELRSKLERAAHQIDPTKNLDAEKMDLRKAKSRLEIELQHATDEMMVLEKKAEDLEGELEAAMSISAEQEEQAWSLKTQLKTLNEVRERDQQQARRNTARLEARIDDLLKMGAQDSDIEAELSSLRASLSEARKREIEHAQKESTARKDYRDLRQRVEKLQQELQDAKNAAALAQSSTESSPRSSRTAEIQELRKQLSSSQEKSRDYRSQAKSLDRQVAEQKAIYEQLEYEKAALEQEILEVRQSNDAMLQKNLEATSTMGELRKKIHSLERELHETRFDKHMKDSEVTRTAQVAEERQELHDHLKAAAIELEQLQSIVHTRDEEIRTRQKHERDLESQLRALRKEKRELNDKATGALGELERASRRYQRAVEKSAQMQAAWDEERKAIRQRVRFSDSTAKREDTKASKSKELSIRKAEEKHRAELKGLAKQIQYLRAKLSRETTFRSDLAFSKNFFLMQIDLYNSCNEANMQLIEQMGIFPDRYTRERRPKLRSVIHAVVATVKIRRLQQSWSVNRELKATLASSLDQARRESSARKMRTEGVAI